MKIHSPAFALAVIFLILSSGGFAYRAVAATPVDCSVESLIEAIRQANTDAGSVPQTLDLSDGCQYTLSETNNSGDHGANGLPQITVNLIIKGNNSIIERSSQRETPMFRIFQVNAGASLSLEGLTLQNGHNDLSNQDEEGGAIFNRGTLEISKCAILNNLSGCGGAIYNYNKLTVTNTTFVGNVANM
jgi:hypothetical protein